MPYNRILVALAGKPDEERVIHEAVRIARGMQSALAVLHVNDPEAGRPSRVIPPEPRVTESDIRDAFRHLGYAHDAEHLTVILREAKSYPKAIATATTAGYDLLVIGHRQRHGFLAAFIDTVDKHLADLVACPILVVPRGT